MQVLHGALDVTTGRATHEAAHLCQCYDADIFYSVGIKIQHGQLILYGDVTLKLSKSRSNASMLPVAIKHPDGQNSAEHEATSQPCAEHGNAVKEIK